MTRFETLLDWAEKSRNKSKEKERIKHKFLNEHPEIIELAQKCSEIKEIVKKMRKDFKPDRKLELYKDEMESHILDCILYSLEKK
jgi:hypothetical protein